MPYKNYIEFYTPVIKLLGLFLTGIKASFLLSQGCLETVNKLLGEGADPNTKDHAGWTPLVSESSTVGSQEFFLNQVTST